MWQFLRVVTGVFAGCITALAGQMYGSITSNGAPVANTKLRIDCRGAVTQTVTSGDGSYRVMVPQEGRCTLTLGGPDGPYAVVFSYPNPVQYDFAVIRRPDGGYELRRQ